MLLVGTLLCLANAEPAPLTGRALVDSINKKGLFEAVYDPEALNTRTLGLKIDPNRAVPINNFGFSNDFPTEFDVATNWPECADVVNNIRDLLVYFPIEIKSYGEQVHPLVTIFQMSLIDQSKCGSCWAVSAAGAISDRICVATNGSVKVSISSYQAAACAGGDGCLGGMLETAFDEFVEQGLPTGSETDKNEGCRPYPFKHCAHHTTSTTYPNCSKLEDYRADKCYDTCQSGYDKEYDKDLYYGVNLVDLDSYEEAQSNIIVNGSIIIAFEVYESFLYYKSGIYQHLEEEEVLGGHAVRVVGWGVEDGQKYWRIANS